MAAATTAIVWLRVDVGVRDRPMPAADDVDGVERMPTTWLARASFSACGRDDGWR